MFAMPFLTRLRLNIVYTSKGKWKIFGSCAGRVTFFSYTHQDFLFEFELENFNLYKLASKQFGETNNWNFKAYLKLFVDMAGNTLILKIPLTNSTSKIFIVANIGK